MPIDILKEAIFWSMKENLTLQFIYPDYKLPDEYKEEIAKTFHADIVSYICEDKELREGADVVVIDSFDNVDDYPFNKDQSYVFRSSMQEILENADKLYSIMPKANRMNIVITDIPVLKKGSEGDYAKFLEALSDKVAEEYKSGHALQINLLTDRILLDSMNNCNAGDESIALCPDGKFYICPAFYTNGENSLSIGDLKEGLDIKNPQLYKISHAPICRNCDAYQCRRCIWLNKNTTLEVNTPGNEQCVVAHIERNASRKLLEKIREIGIFMPEKEIKEIDYLDPFAKLQDKEI